MKILSLFDGISCARVALDRLGIKIDKYYASEIDKYAIQIALKNYPNTIEVGDVTKLKGSDFQDIDLLIGGSPCQDLSIAKKNRQGLDGARSGLFWEYVRLLNEIKPKYFVLENVNSMPKEAKQIITDTLGVEPIMINASLVSAQNRKRLFWTNIPNVTQPEDKGILLKDILENGDSDRLKSYCIDASYYKGGNLKHYLEKGTRQLVFETKRIGQFNSGGQGDRVYSPDGKSVALSANGGGRGAKTGLYCISSTQKHATITTDKSSPTVASMGIGGGHIPMIIGENIQIRKLTPIECERLMTLPDNYTEGLSNTQRYKCLGNGFVVDVVSHILKCLNKNYKNN